jgi:hypothetical protein
MKEKGGTMKPPILSEQQVIDWIKASYGKDAIIVPSAYGKAAQLDADVAYYELLIEQAKAEVAREMEDWLETHLYARPDRPNATMGFNDWLELKKLLSKYTGGKK